MGLHATICILECTDLGSATKTWNRCIHISAALKIIHYRFLASAVVCYSCRCSYSCRCCVLLLLCGMGVGHVVTLHATLPTAYKISNIKSDDERSQMPVAVCTFMLSGPLIYSPTWPRRARNPHSISPCCSRFKTHCRFFYFLFILFIYFFFFAICIRLCGLLVRVSGCRSRGPGSIPGSTRLSEK
jgi:hypothetical protein